MSGGVVYSPLIRAALSFLIPGGVLFAAMAVAAENPSLVRWFSVHGDLYAATAVIAAFLLGWRFDRSRLVFATVVFGLGAWLLHHAGSRHDALTRIIPDAVALLLPLNIALMALAKERGIFTLHGLLRWSVIALQPFTIWVLLHFRRYDWLGVLDAQPIPAGLLPDLRLEQGALLAFVLALVTIGYQCLRQRNAMENALFWALALVGYGLLRSPSTGLALAYFATATVILIAAAVEVSHAMAYRDELTGLPARRALNQTLLKLGNRYSIAMLDVDHFKKFNDTYGHDAGDQVLQMVASRLLRVRGGGRVFRFGGEEFAIVFRGRSAAEVQPLVESLREAIAHTEFALRGPQRDLEKTGQKPKSAPKHSVTITISIGVADHSGRRPTPDMVVEAADAALYRAKEAGRNCVKLVEMPQQSKTGGSAGVA
jgi:diguanylate cyclase (GGDEF)-like protein